MICSLFRNRQRVIRALWSSTLWDKHHGQPQIVGPASGRKETQRQRQLNQFFHGQAPTRHSCRAKAGLAGGRRGLFGAFAAVSVSVQSAHYNPHKQQSTSRLHGTLVGQHDKRSSATTQYVSVSPAEGVFPDR